VVALPDGITLRRPGRGPYVVSTRTLGGVRRRALMSAVTAFAVAAAALAGSVVAFVVLL